MPSSAMDSGSRADTCKQKRPAASMVPASTDEPDTMESNRKRIALHANDDIGVTDVGRKRSTAAMDAGSNQQALPAKKRARGKTKPKLVGYDQEAHDTQPTQKVGVVVQVQHQKQHAGDDQRLVPLPDRPPDDDSDSEHGEGANHVEPIQDEEKSDVQKGKKEKKPRKRKPHDGPPKRKYNSSGKTARDGKQSALSIYAKMQILNVSR